METLSATPDQLERFWEKVNKTESCWIWTAGCQRDGYGHFNSGSRSYIAHRFSYMNLVGPIANEMVIDHKCHNIKCVNPRHLQQVTRAINNQNKRGPYKNGKSGFRGVSWRADRNKWQANIRIDGKRKHLGYFNSPALANEAAVRARNELFSNNLADIQPLNT